MALRALATIQIVVPSIDRNHPQTIHKGEIVPADVAAFCRDLGWASDDGVAGEPIPAADSAPTPTPAPPATKPTAGDGAAAAQAAAAASIVMAPPFRARTTRRTNDVEQPEVVYSKGVIVDGDIARRLVAAGHAVELKDGVAPETK